MQKSWDNPRSHTMPARVRVPASFAVGKVQVAPATVLAPMVGVTDTIFRRFIRNSSLFTPSAAGNDVEAPVTNQQSGCGLLMTEFTSADGLARMRESKRKRYPHLLRRRASHLGADLRLQPGDAGRSGPHR